MRVVLSASMLATVMLLLACAATAAPMPIANVFIENFGAITMQLRPDHAPATVANFISLAEQGFYSAAKGANTSLYRYYPKFVIQGGNLNSASNQTVPLEYSLPNVKYSVGLARSNDPHSGSSEFFVNVANNTEVLAPHPAQGRLGYAVFAEVIGGGIDVVDRLEKLPEHADPAYGGMHMFDHPPRIVAVTIDRQ